MAAGPWRAAALARAGLLADRGGALAPFAGAGGAVGWWGGQIVHPFTNSRNRPVADADDFRDRPVGLQLRLDSRLLLRIRRRRGAGAAVGVSWIARSESFPNWGNISTFNPLKISIAR
jgi:hypothetical protein